MVASAAPTATGRYASANLDEAPVEPARATMSQPVAQAYAAEPVRTIAPSAPVAASIVSTASSSSASASSGNVGVPVRGAPLPPNRPFDLDTIANAGKPVVMQPRATPLPPVRTNVASLFAAPERSPTQRFSNAHPLVRDLSPQSLQPLSRN
jgi:rare lipoprotein A